ncbi:MAG TPA: DUF4214 domain-containing protein, partial [Pirellulales bacterium]|nr:DUF4214 domain-containing protein [Pirellulales bacterium]
VNPGQPLADTQLTDRGFHADQWQVNAYFVNYQDVLNAATAVKNGTATAATLQVAPSSIASLSTLGGSPPTAGAGDLWGSYFNPTTDNYYLLLPDSHELLVWHVAAPSTPLTTPAAPGGMTATAGNGEISLSWAPVSDAAYYTVYRGTTSGGESATPLITGLTSTSLADLGLPTGGTYYYQVAAANAAGASTLSQEVFASLASPGPTGLSATAGNGHVSFSWSPVVGATSYNVYRGTTSGGEVALATGVTADAFTDTTAANLQTYYYQVTAVESVGETGKSAEVAATPMTAHEQYVVAVYQDVLGRAADLSGLVAWAHELDVGIPVSSVAMSIAHSLEYYARFVIEPAFEKLLGRTADTAAINSLAAQMQAGMTDEQLEGALLASNEFLDHAGNTASGWVSNVYQTLFGRTPDPSGLAFWEEALATGETYSQVAQAIAASQENNTQLIEADYSHYLGRAADAAGLAAWLQQLGAGTTNEDIIAGFTGSLEYYELHTH